MYNRPPAPETMPDVPDTEVRPRGAPSDPRAGAGERDIEDVLPRVTTWLDDGRGVALATVTRTWGSSPRPAGSQLAVRDDGAFVGSVSGGCIEGAVVKEALGVIADGTPRRLTFGVSNEDAWSVGLACGGKVDVHVQRVGDGDAELSPRLIATLRDAAAARRPVVLATRLDTGAQRLVPLDDGDNSDAPIRAAALDAARRDRSHTVETDSGDVFLGVYNPPLRLCVVGAVHIAQALCPMAQLAGFAITVIDPRAAFATPERFPGVELHTEWPDDAIEELSLDRRCAVVTLTHDPKIDEPALTAALATPVFYIGALGSRKTQAARLGRLRAAGHDDAALARIHGPVGLRIGAQSAAEIAVSILAELIAALRSAP